MKKSYPRIKSSLNCCTIMVWCSIIESPNLYGTSSIPITFIGSSFAAVKLMGLDVMFRLIFAMRGHMAFNVTADPLSNNPVFVSPNIVI